MVSVVGVAHDADTPTPHMQGDDNQILANEITSASNDHIIISNLT